MEAPRHINLQQPDNLTLEERRELAKLYQEAKMNGDTIPGLTIRHIGQEAWVAANSYDPTDRRGNDKLHI